MIDDTEKLSCYDHEERLPTPTLPFSWEKSGAAQRSFANSNQMVPKFDLPHEVSQLVHTS